jgi:hypothetical protein
MQLLDNPQTQLLDAVPQLLLDTLQEIVTKVQIESKFRISHTDFKSGELSDEVVARFQELPEDIQLKYLSQQLRGFLYGMYYNGSLRSRFAAEVPVQRPDLENNSFLGVDLTFYERVHESNSGIGYFDPGWRLLREESDGSLAVTKNGLTLHVERDRHLHPQSAGVGEEVAVRMPRNLVQNGFYMAVGNAGLQRHSHRDGKSQIVRIYFHFTPEGATAVMGSLTRKLNDRFIPFSFKVLYNPTEYKRYDSGVLYFEKINCQEVGQVVRTVYTETKAHFMSEVPLFTKFLAPGLALAEEPDYKFASRESFGLNRCQIVANGLLEAWHSGEHSPEGRMNAIVQQFSRLGIDLQRSYLNASSLDIYMPVDL